MITSTSNPKIKNVRALQKRGRVRQEEQAFVVEGVRLAEEAVGAGWVPIIAFHTQDLSPRGQDLLLRLHQLNVQIEPVEPHVMQAASDTRSPQGILLKLPLAPLMIPGKPSFILVLDQLRDPGNLGTILRSALAAGVDAVLLSPGCVDALSPKVLRAGMGAHFRLPVSSLSWEEIGQRVHRHELQVLLAAADEGQVYLDTDMRIPTALLIGGETSGAGAHAKRLATSQIHIPMPGNAQSLNAAVAAAVLMFEVVRQRQRGFADQGSMA